MPCVANRIDIYMRSSNTVGNALSIIKIKHDKEYNSQSLQYSIGQYSMKPSPLVCVLTFVCYLFHTLHLCRQTCMTMSSRL